MVTYPEDWFEEQLGKISDVTKLAGFEFTEHVIYSNYGSIIALRGLNVKQGKLILDDVKYIDGSNFLKLVRSKLYKNDLLFTYVGTVGEVAVIPENDKYYLAPNVSRIRFNDKCCPDYFMYYMRSVPFYKNVVEPLIATSSQPALSMQNIRKFRMHFPDVKEQEKIARTLLKFDIYIDDLTELIDKKRSIRNGALEDLMSGKTKIDGYETKWRTYSFDNYFSTLSNNTFSRDKLSEYGEVGDIHYGDVLINYGDVLTDADSIPRIKDTTLIKEKWYLKRNDVIIADTAEDDSVGKVVQIGSVSIPLVGGLHTVVCRPNYDTAEGFLGYYMNSKSYHDQLYPYITGIKVSSISKKSFGETVLTIPVDVDEQAAIASVLTAMDEEIKALEAERDKMIQIREGAMDDLLTGRVRLKV